MLKTALLSTLMSMTALPALPHDAAGKGPGINGTVVLSPAQADGVARLEFYGTRFDKAIRAIRAQAALPGWGGDDCGHETPAAEVRPGS